MHLLVVQNKLGMSQKLVTFSTSPISIADNEFKIKSLYNNDLILNIAVKSKETVQKLKFWDSPNGKQSLKILPSGSL